MGSKRSTLINIVSHAINPFKKRMPNLRRLALKGLFYKLNVSLQIAERLSLQHETEYCIHEKEIDDVELHYNMKKVIFFL